MSPFILLLTVRQSEDNGRVECISCSQCVHQGLGGKGIRVDDYSVRTHGICTFLCPGADQDSPGMQRVRGGELVALFCFSLESDLYPLTSL